MDKGDMEVLREAREESEKVKLTEGGASGSESSSSSQTAASKREKMHKEVYKKQLKVAMTSIRKADSKFWMNQRRNRGTFRVGDKVVLNYSLKKSLKKACFGKGYYPYSGE